MLYHYLATDKSERLHEDDVDAESVQSVLRLLAERELRPVSVTKMEVEKKGIFSSKIKIADKIFLTKYLSLMLSVGTDLLSAINILIVDFDKPAVKNLLLEIRDSLSHGKPFYEAFAEHPQEFSPVFINLIKAAEASGNLQQTFEDLSTSLEQDAALKNRVKAVLVYPAILLSGSLVIFIFLSTFALPKISKVFVDSGIDPPVFSRIVLAIGLFVNNYIVLFLALVIFSAAFLFYFFTRNPVGRRVVEYVVSHAPILKKVHRDLAVQRFASTFSSLMRAGLPIVAALEISADVVGSDDYRQAILRIANEGVAKGLSISDSFRKELVFPRMLTNLIAISEKAGHMEQILKTLSDFYASRVENSIRMLVSFLEPILLVLMGLIVGGIALAIIVPIYQLASQV
ncbi:MAG: hypothetical protein A2946_03270 [Candidatus Liptonbacteria bacterium RIFCSPLOWO2_01_FULL_53_13]|uniref:Type II secretion system protein GspF domain-containing protein n=1 Tax=Candidatus Liptonbacteria bacterium RIFCSPLOWO2_01_FULL_53_13 TaxID=1798651 RepID=A0A1G2CK66_9BACT|nr:MAG: hypothetical protein A2946_03270 [Candidatus Liptonbacteria bacterium RIFCSPLOWO2_01_FULL_53_13]